MSRNCKHCRQELSVMAPGTPLPTQVAAHLENCPACRSWREQDAAAWYALGRISSPAMPVGLVSSIMQAVAERSQRSWGPILKLATAAAVLVGALAGGWLGSSLLQPQLSEPVPAPEELYAELFDAVPAATYGLPIADEIDGRLP